MRHVVYIHGLKSNDDCNGCVFFGCYYACSWLVSKSDLWLYEHIY
jgi:hypothetical protein